MKNLLILITIMLVGGCDKSPTLEERVVGEYVHGAWTYSLNYNPNKFHEYVRGEREHTGTWTIKDGELHCKEDPQSDYTFEENGPDGKNFYVTKGEYGGATRVFSIDTNGYITSIAEIKENGEKDGPKGFPTITYKKIK